MNIKVYPFVILLLLAAEVFAAENPPVDFEALRRFYLADTYMLRDYRPGKNSFVEGPDRRLGSYTRPGQRLTLLDLRGPGQLCHIWSTWREGNGRYRLELYLDGADKPQITGTLDELIAAAKSMRNPPVPVPGFVGQRGARNLFLPVRFQDGLRIEMETIEPAWLIFMQIDYRQGLTAGGRNSLEATIADGRLTLQDRSAPAPGLAIVSPKIETIRKNTTIPAHGQAGIVSIPGPAIVRRWRIRADAPVSLHNQLDLEVRYDGAGGAAVRAPLGDFFGPFRGVSMCSETGTGIRTCYLPMPFASNAVFTLTNKSGNPVTCQVEADFERQDKWNGDWRYFHALWLQTQRTTGYRQHQVLYLRGRGHWLGMSLYDTGHDHGGGDFTVIDGEGGNPAFLHGINGEDYFTFAWFGRGEHHPYAIAYKNEEGRYRHHFENPYPFQKSLSVYWGTYPDLSPRSVAFWYQDTPEDTTVADADNPLNVDWDCFGPVPLTPDAGRQPGSNQYDVLPSVADLDAGKTFACRCVQEKFTSGWVKQRSIGPMLDLTYLSRHGTRINGEVELGGMGHAFLARRTIVAPGDRTVRFMISHDDQLRVLINGSVVYTGGANNGFANQKFLTPLRTGTNEVVVQLTSFFNVTFNWAGFALSMVE